MEAIHDLGISAIATIQARFSQQTNFMFLLSTVFDPRYAFLIFAPLAFSLDRYTGRKLMWTVVVAEWSNQVLKWALRGDRPFWYVYERAAQNTTSDIEGLPYIKQFKLTCETGPGNPSGHAMVTAATWYIIFAAVLRNIGTFKSTSKNNVINRTIWSIYTIILGLVSLSRIYIAAHFPHQCLLGMIIGVAVAILVSNMDTDRFERNHYIKGTVFMFATAMATYAILQMFGFNPMWSVDRALKWCAKREYVHLDTTPFFSMMRYTGFFLGMGLGLHSSFHKYATQIKFTTEMKAIVAFASLSVCRASEYVHLPKENLTLFYALAFALNACLPYIFIAIIPYVVSRVCYKRPRSKSL